MTVTGWQRTTSVFLIGLGVGAGLGILFAPKAGEETRNDIVGTARKGVDAVRDGVDGVVEQGAKLSRRAQKTLEAAKDLAKDAADAGGQAYRDAKASVS